MSEVIDYRVSRIVVHCKDCGLDVGLYPARHKCGVAAEMSLDSNPPVKKSGTQNDSNIESDEGGLNEGLWSKLRTVRNWKDVSTEGTSILAVSQPTQGYKLWDKLLNAATVYKTVEGDSENESEKEDWEGETHISRILREYYMKKSGDIPQWLYDSKPSSSDGKSIDNPTITSLRDNRKRLAERNENLSPRSNSDDTSGRGISKDNGIEQSKIHISPPDSPLPAPVINRGRENGGYDRPPNMKQNHYTQSGSQFSGKNYELGKYNARINDSGLYNPRTLNARSPSNDNGRIMQHRLRGSTEKLDDYSMDRSRTRELIINAGNRARSVSPSPSVRVPPSGIYGRYRETGDIRDINQDPRVPTGRSYRKF